MFRTIFKTNLKWLKTFKNIYKRMAKGEEIQNKVKQKEKRQRGKDPKTKTQKRQEKRHR